MNRVTFATPPASPRQDESDGGRRRRRGRVLIPTLIILVLAGLLFVVFTSFYTDLLWFRSVGKSSVFSRELIARIGQPSGPSPSATNARSPTQ